MHVSTHNATITPKLTCALAGLMVVLFIAVGPAPAPLIYDRSAVLDGEWWRLLTAHLVHSDTAHLAWNVAGLLILGALLERVSRPALITSLLSGLLAVDFTLWGALPQMHYYCGLSGALNAILPPLLAASWVQTRSPFVPLVALVTLSKIAIELAMGQAIFTDTVWGSVPLAHFAGWVGGVAVLGFGVCRVGLAGAGKTMTAAHPRRRATQPRHG